MFTLLKSQLALLRPSEQPDYILRFLISQVEQGHLAAGYKLPSVRALSSQLQINVNWQALSPRVPEKAVLLAAEVSLKRYRAATT